MPEHEIFKLEKEIEMVQTPEQENRYLKIKTITNIGGCQTACCTSDLSFYLNTLTMGNDG